jgi:hypothetical protein
MLPESIRDEHNACKKTAIIAHTNPLNPGEWERELHSNMSVISTLRQVASEDLGLTGLSVPQEALDILAEFVAPERMPELMDRFAHEHIRTRPPLNPTVASRILLDCVKTSASLLGPQNMQAAIMVETTFKFLLNEVALVIRRHTETGRISEPDVQVIVQDVQRAIPDLRARVIEASKSNPTDNSNHS